MTNLFFTFKNKNCCYLNDFYHKCAFKLIGCLTWLVHQFWLVHLTLSLPVHHWAGDNTVLPINNNLSKTVRVNIAFTERFLKSIR